MQMKPQTWLLSLAKQEMLSKLLDVCLQLVYLRLSLHGSNGPIHFFFFSNNTDLIWNMNM